MAKPIDLSSKMTLKSAAEELAIPPGTVEMGQNIGGVSMFSNLFRRGHGNQTFGVSADGWWMGAVDFADAPVKFAIDGTFTLTGATGAIVIDANGITQYDENDVPVGYWGLREGMF